MPSEISVGEKSPLRSKPLNEFYGLFATIDPPLRYSRRMTEPSLKVIGVYRPVISADAWREQFQVTGDEQATREHFEKLVLIEAVVEGLTGRFDFSKFGQVLSSYRNYPDNMQVGYDEGLLSGTANV